MLRQLSVQLQLSLFYRGDRLLQQIAGRNIFEHLGCLWKEEVGFPLIAVSSVRPEGGVKEMGLQKINR